MNEFEQLAREIVGGYRRKLDYMGDLLKGQMIKEASSRKIRAKGDFINNMSYEVVETPTALILRLGSKVEHAKYVLGGKVPSWTPLEPLMEWIKVRKIVWWDKNRKMEDKEIAWLISRKHKREGIEPRNIVQDVIDKREGWIRKELESTGGRR
jgi:hypothetical protein